MANVGGGWIVIGFNDSTLQPDSKHSQELAATYDSTQLSDAVDKITHGDQPIRLSVFLETHPETQLAHPIIRVQGFERTPYICRSSKSAPGTDQEILQTDKVYIRRPGAATSEIQTPSEWEDLLRRCVSQRRDDFFSQFVDLFRRMNEGDSTPREDTKESLSRWMIDQWNKSTTNRFLPAGYGLMESAQMLVRPLDSKWTVHDLRKAAVSAKLPYTKWLNNSLLAPMTDGVEARIDSPANHLQAEYWHLKHDGRYYYSGLFREDYESPFFSSSMGHPKRTLWFDLAIFRIAKALLRSATLYEELNIAADEAYMVSIRHGGLQRRTIYASEMRYPYYTTLRRTSLDDSHQWEGEVTRDLIGGQLIELTHKVID